MRIPCENSLSIRQRDLLPGLSRRIYVLLVILCLSATAFGQTATEGNDPDHLEAALQDDAVEEEYGARFIPPDSAIPNLGKLSGVRRIEPGSVSTGRPGLVRSWDAAHDADPECAPLSSPVRRRLW